MYEKLMGAVVTLMIAAFGLVGVIYSRLNKRVDNSPTKDECDLRHDALNTTLDRIQANQGRMFGKLDSINNRLAYLDGVRDAEKDERKI